MLRTRRLARLADIISRQSLSRRTRPALAAWCLVAAVRVIAVGPASADVPKNVLVITSESMSMPAASIVVNGTVSALRAWGPVNIFVESLDRSRFPSDTEGLTAFFGQRYLGRRLDLVVTVCAPALDFVMRHRQALFPGAPIVFSFVDPGMVRPFGPDASMSGVFLDPDYGGVVNLALQLHPGTRQVLVVDGVSEFDRGWLASATHALEVFDSRLRTTIVTDKPLSGMLGELATAPDDAVILFLSVSRDSDGATFVPRDVLSMVRRVSQVPVYGVASTYVGHGVVGGPVFDFQAHAADVGRLAVRVLAGEAAGSIAPTKTANTLAFDWRELQRFKIKESALPTGAAVLYRERAFWSVHRNWIVATVLLVVGQTVLIGMMLAHRRKRSSLQASLKARLRFETILSDVSTALGGVPVVRMETTIRAALGMIRRYLGVDRVSLFELTADGRITRAADDAAPGSPPVPDSYVIAELPFITLSLAALQPFVVERLDDLPQEADRERHVFEAAGIRSLALVPLEVGGRGLGALSCVCHRSERTWPADIMQQVRTLGQVLATVIDRRQTDSAVSESDQLKGAILSSIPAHITVLDREGVIIAVNDAWMAYARANGVRGEASVSPGASYFKVCERAAAEGAPDAAEALAGIKAVCEGRSDSFEREYRCPDNIGADRWFGMKVTSLRRAEGGALVTHWDTTREKNQEMALRELSGRLLNAQEEERRRIARELHDDLQQRLALMAIELDGIALGYSELAPDDIADRARELWRQANEISTELHQLSHRLHPTKLEALGLLATVEAYCRELSKTGLNVTFTHDGLPRTLPPEVALCVFRVVQESLQNVLKHSGASEAGVTMSATDDHLRFIVSDSGRGFDVEAVLSRGGLGLVSMRERLHLVGGTMSIRSTPGEGTSVQARVPLAINDMSPREAMLQGT